MPKFVDHDQRRLDIIRATWRLMAAKGIHGTTMREIAREAGFANGALAPYFSNKEAILSAAFSYVFTATNGRMDEIGAHNKGLAALRGLLLEIFPLDDEKVLEARIVVPFWEQATHNPKLMAVHTHAMSTWRDRMLRHLSEARSAGETHADLDRLSVVDEMIAMANGIQAMVLLLPGDFTSERQLAMIDDFLTRITR